jgi:addiction module HigA family antidote
MALRMHASLRVHPGDWLRTEVIEEHGLALTEAAGHLGVTRQALSRLVNGHYGLSADMALRIEKVFGIRAETLMRMQVAFDLARAREHEAERMVRPLAA